MPGTGGPSSPGTPRHRDTCGNKEREGQGEGHAPCQGQAIGALGGSPGGCSKGHGVRGNHQASLWSKPFTRAAWISRSWLSRSRCDAMVPSSSASGSAWSSGSRPSGSQACVPQVGRPPPKGGGGGGRGTPPRGPPTPLLASLAPPFFADCQVFCWEEKTLGAFILNWEGQPRQVPPIKKGDRSWATEYVTLMGAGCRSCPRRRAAEGRGSRERHGDESVP